MQVAHYFNANKFLLRVSDAMRFSPARALDAHFHALNPDLQCDIVWAVLAEDCDLSHSLMGLPSDSMRACAAACTVRLKWPSVILHVQHPMVESTAKLLGAAGFDGHVFARFGPQYNDNVMPVRHMPALTGLTVEQSSDRHSWPFATELVQLSGLTCLDINHLSVHARLLAPAIRGLPGAHPTRLIQLWLTSVLRGLFKRPIQEAPGRELA